MKTTNHYKGICIILGLLCSILALLWLLDNNSANIDKKHLESLNEAITAEFDSVNTLLFEKSNKLDSLVVEFENQPKAKTIYVKVNNEIISIDTLSSNELSRFFSEFNSRGNQ